MVAAAFLPSVSENVIWRKFTSLHKKVHLISKPIRSGEGVSWWTEVACTSTFDESLKNHLIIWRTACTSPSKSASTRPSWVLRTQPRKRNSTACRRTRSRKVVSCTTLPEMKACERKRYKRASVKGAPVLRWSALALLSSLLCGPAAGASLCLKLRGLPHTRRHRRPYSLEPMVLCR